MSFISAKRLRRAADSSFNRCTTLWRWYLRKTSLPCTTLSENTTCGRVANPCRARFSADRFDAAGLSARVIFAKLHRYPEEARQRQHRQEENLQFLIPGLPKFLSVGL